MKNNKKVIISLVGVLIMLLLIISATYAYFSVTITGNGSKTMITANTPKKHSLSVSTLYDDIHIHVDNNDMKLVNAGSYYGAVDKDNRYETDLTTGTHNIIEVSSKGMENIRYSCSGDIKVTLNIDNGSMGSVLEREDVLLYLKGLGLDETLDLSTLKINNTKIYTTTFEIDGDSSDYLSAIVELVNKPSYQNYIANKILNVKIEAENMVCRENGTYKYLVKLNKNVKEIQNDRETDKTVSLFYDEEGLYQKIQNIYLVDYINTSKAIKTWELGDNDRGTKSNEVMGWLEVTPDEDDRYDLYIGSNGPMRAPQDMSNAFQDFTNLKKITGDALDTSEVINMGGLFYRNTNLIDISAVANWNTQNVTSIRSMFGSCKKLNDINALSNWNTSKVGDMYYMFGGAGLTDVTPLSNWDVSHVTNMQGLFESTHVSNVNPLKLWKTSSLVNPSSMFVYDGDLIDISGLANWDMSNVTNLENMFWGTSISDISPLSNWNIPKITSIGGMFWCTEINDLSPIAHWDTSNVTNMAQIFNSTNIIDLSPITNWDVSNVKNMSNMFYITPIKDLTPIKDWNTKSVTDMAAMFAGAQINDLNPIKSWNITKVTNMENMFANCSNLTDLGPLSNWDVSHVTNMKTMFYGIKTNDFKALASWNTQNVTNMSYMFQNSSIDDLTPLKDWNVSNVTDMSGMFSSTQINDITPITNWDTKNVTNMGDYKEASVGMFQNCSNLTKVDLSNWNVPKLISIHRMFAGCTKLVELKLPKASYNQINDISNYQAIFGGEFTNDKGRVNVTSTVSNNITVYTESSQVEWVKDRLQESLGENNNSTVITY